MTKKISNPKETITEIKPNNKFKQHIFPVVAILFSLLLFFNEVIFEGKVYISGDAIASKSFENVVKEARYEGIQTLWNPYIFCGMPGLASMTFTGDRMYDLSELVHGKVREYFSFILGNSTLGGYIYFYFIFAIGVYFYAFEKLKRKSIAFFVAMATLYSTFIIIWISVAHMTKIAVLAFFPFLLIVIEKLQKKLSFIWICAGVIIVHFMLLPGHIQMIFYILLSIFFYYLFFLIRKLILKESPNQLLKSGFTLVGIGILALGMSGDIYFSTLEYAPYSIRGASPTTIEQTVDQNKQASSGGLDYDYATSWSFSPGEMGTFLIPSLYGFGNLDYKGILTNNQTTRLNTYFGPQPFTDAPQYMGVAVLLLALFGIYYLRKDLFVQFMTFVILFSLLVSFGKEFSLLYDLMFYYVPMFNKFRIPSMILILVQFFIPLLAGYGLLGIVNSSNKKLSDKWKILSIVFGSIFIISLLVPSIFETLYEHFFPTQEITTLLSRSYGTQPEVLSELYRFISERVVTDITIGVLFLLVISISIYFFLQKKLSYKYLISIIVFTAIIDLWRVNSTTMELHSRREAQSNFVTPEHVKFILQDTTKYRVLEFVNGQPPYNNSLAYWKIESAYGYQGAKMRNYQDMVDNVGLNNPMLWGLMNVKYIFSDRADSNQILLPIYKSKEQNILFNRFSLPRAFFVSKLQKATPQQILKHIKDSDFNPIDIAFTNEDVNEKIDAPLIEAKAIYTSHKLNEINLNVTTTGNNLLFLSETWYPKGWKAYLNEKEIPIYRLNYMFRGVVIPKGEYKLTMKFEPSSYQLGKILSFGINLIAIASLLFFGIQYFRKK